MLNNSMYKLVSQKLFELFFVDYTKYGRQQEDGTYRLIREKLSVVTIDDMLLNQKSLLTYQETHTLNTAFIRWICIDLDISKAEIDQHEVNNENLKSVLISAKEIITWLMEAQIPYLLEFSGRRGFHIWIVFEELQTKEVGYNLINYILSKVILQPKIIADRFPKTKGVNKNTKKVGFGVKLPLSQNKASGKLSFFLHNPDSFDFNTDSWPCEASETFLGGQLQILQSYTPLTTFKINALLQSLYNEQQNFPERSLSYLKNIQLNTSSQTSISLDAIINNLKQCDHFKQILIDYQNGLSAKERSIIVGLLGQLKTHENDKLGYDILMEFFSRIKGFKKELTEEKLKLIKYYFPVSCSQLGQCSFCRCKVIDSPIELLEGVNIQISRDVSLPIISEGITFRLIEALKKYSISNDEIPLYPLIKKIENASYAEINRLINTIYDGGSASGFECFHFLRNEGNKVRSLYSLDAQNNIISTYFLFVLNNIFYTEISDYSFGYRVAPGFNNYNIFTNWFVNWSGFSKSVSHVLNNVEFSEYYLIKVDIKGFYDKIDLDRLKIKLYEEVPKSIRFKLDGLNDYGLTQYKNIINYLINLSKSTTNNKGLPQGPAYARYLAELYLLGLDKLVEGEILKDKKREYYFRFVDDIFIFVEDKLKANDVLVSVDKWLSLNNLEINNDKTEISKVDDYNQSGKFKKFQDDAKYIIDKANKHKAILSETDIQEALSKLATLTNDVKFGLKDNLRFFYYQFSKDPRLAHIKKKLLKFLPYTDTGRGILYQIFYQDLIDLDPQSFWSITEEFQRLSGLSLGHYLNTILVKSKSIEPYHEILERFFQSIILKTDLSNVDKLLLITIAMKYNLELSKEFLSTCPKTIINSAMETPQIKYTFRDYDFLYSKLEENKDRSIFIKELYIIIIQHPLSKELAQALANYSFLRFSEWRQNDLSDLYLRNEEVLIEYFHTLCFFTLFDNSNDNKALLASWENLLSKSENFVISQPISFNWLNRAVEHSGNDFSRSSYTLLLSKKEGSGLNKYNCRNGFLQKFQQILKVLLFSKDITLERFHKNDESYIDDGSLFAKWWDDPNVRLYPKLHDICVRNLALNGIIALENDTHIFIKTIGKGVDLGSFNYIPICASNQDEEIEIAKDSQITFIEKSSSFKSYFQKVSAFIKLSFDFIKTYQVKYPVYYQNPYSVEEKPLIPYYSFYSQKVSALGVIQVNDSSSFWENIQYLSKINDFNVKIIPEDNTPFNFGISELDERFFPKSDIIINSPEDRMSFITEFAKVTEPFEITSIFQFQYFWSQTVWNFLLQKRKSGSITAYLNIHFSSFTDEKYMAYDILFAINNRFDIIKTNLQNFFDTIRASLVCFQTEATIDDFSIVELLDEEISLLSDFFMEKYMFNFDKFIKQDLAVKTQFDFESKKNQMNLYVNGQIVKDKNILLFERDPIGFYEKTLLELAVIPKETYCFICQNNGHVLIYVPELEMVKAFNRISDRKEFLDRLLKNANEYITLFPKDDHYSFAKKAYEEFNFESIEAKLRDHYITTSNIKERVISWISIFNPESLKGSDLEKFLNAKKFSLSRLYRSILELITLHYSVTEESLKFFTERIREFAIQGCLMFPIKHPGRDENGLFRMLRKCGFKNRELDFESDVKKLYNSDCSDKKLIIIADTTITGQQSERAFRDYYLKEYLDEPDFRQYQRTINNGKEKYFEFGDLDQAIRFKSNLSNIQKIVFITPIITEKFIERMTNLPFLAGKQPEWVFNEKIIGESFNLGNLKMDVDNKEIVLALFSDVQLLNKLFIIPNLRKYKDFNSDPNQLNILLRIGSLPLKHIRLFSLKPKNGKQSLFDYVENWKEEKV